MRSASIGFDPKTAEKRGGTEMPALPAPSSRTARRHAVFVAEINITIQAEIPSKRRRRISFIESAIYKQFIQVRG
jgi:hypothetical protein